MSQEADRALNALFAAERETLGAAPHANPTYFGLLDRLARGDGPPLDVPQGSGPLVGSGLSTTWTAGAATIAAVVGIWGGSLLLDRGGSAQTEVANDRAPAPSAAQVTHEASHPGSPTPVAVAVRADEHSAPSTPTATPAPQAKSSARATNARDTARRVPASARAEDLAEELRLLSAARAAWKAGRAADAFARLADHERRFSHGLLREDRAALEAVLLCETGKLTEGRARARRFLTQHPRSTLVDTVRSACP